MAFNVNCGRHSLTAKRWPILTLRWSLPVTDGRDIPYVSMSVTRKTGRGGMRSDKTRYATLSKGLGASRLAPRVAHEV
jgi:hypothetical protein